MRLRSALLPVALLALLSSAHAETINVSFSGAPTNTDAGSSSNDFAGTGTASLFDFDLSLPVTSLIGYTGGALCSTSRSCGPQVGAQVSAVEMANTGVDANQLTSGAVTLVLPQADASPEPPALLLLGTGVLGLGILLRKRYV